jgi:hypothetical protein
MRYFKAWYVREREALAVDEHFPEWVVYAASSADAEAKVLRAMERTEPDRGFRVQLIDVPDEDEGTGAFATARQLGQALD